MSAPPSGMETRSNTPGRAISKSELMTTSIAGEQEYIALHLSISPNLLTREWRKQDFMVAMSLPLDRRKQALAR
jgi:hypothetical protein